MLDPSLPWLAVGYRNFKQEDFCQRQIRDEMTKCRIDTTDVSSVLRLSTPQGRQRRRIKSATATRFTSRGSEGFTRPMTTRPKSAKSYHPNYLRPNTERTPSARPCRPRSAFLPHHQPSPAQNRSVSAVEHHLEKTVRLYVEGRDSKCAFCPVECRPKSSSSNRPTSSTGLVAAHVPTHYDRYVSWTRPRTAPATKRDFLQLPRHNNIRRGHIPHYTNFVKRVELGPRDRTPSPRPRRRLAFEEESAKLHSPSLKSSLNADDEEGELFLSEEEVVDDEVEEDVFIRIPTPTEPHLDEDEFDDVEEPPSNKGQEAWMQPKAPTPSPALSGRNSPEPDVPQISLVEPETEESPPPREPTPPPHELTPPPREPTPPPWEPTPPQRELTPPPRELTPPLRELTPPPREPTPPPPKPKPKKEVRIKETPVPPPTKPKTVPQSLEKTSKSCLAKKPEVVKESIKPPPKPPTPEPAHEEVIEVTAAEADAPEEVVPIATEEETTKDALVMTQDDVTQTDQTSNSEMPADDAENKQEKKKLAPPPKYKVDLFAVDSQAMKDLLDMEMKMRRKGPGSHVSDTDSALIDIPDHLLKRKPFWQHGRLALSRRAGRFEIPMDVYLLESMTATEYLQKYCIVSKRRQAMYRRSFSRADRDNDMKINMKEFNTAVMEALVDTVTTEQIQDVLRLIEADGFTHFGPKLFCAICALLERLHYRDFVTEDTVDQESLVEKERVEDADFLALDWKFDGCAINPPLKRLLYML